MITLKLKLTFLEMVDKNDENELQYKKKYLLQRLTVSR